MRFEGFRVRIIICFLFLCKDNLSNQITSKDGKDKNSQDLAKFKEQVFKEMEDHNKIKIEQVYLLHSFEIESKRDK